jgi:glycosyltransferase involved in cell wall biosynthesis
MTPPKIVHMTTVHPALDGRIFHKECRSLARAGFAVTIIGPHSDDTVADQVRIKSMPQDQLRFSRMTREVWRVYREALRQRADVYHFHDPELIPAGLLLRANGKKVIYDIHENLPKDILSKHYLPIWSRHLISWMANQVEATACRHFSALVAVTPAIAERFRPLNDRTVVVHNYPYPEEVTLTQPADLHWGARREAVAYIGGITAQRGIREMVEAMALLPNSLRATLELAGNEIPEDAHPRELYSHPGWARVRHHGFMKRARMFSLLSEVRAGLVIFHPEPNHLEAMPQKIFEYMGAGLPLIVSDFPLWRRIVGTVGCGILVDPLNPSAIARAIEYVLTHPKEAEDMGRRGQAAVLKQYNWETEAEKLVNLYSGLVEPACVE